jgi:hypothetical protein
MPEIRSALRHRITELAAHPSDFAQRQPAFQQR